MPQTVCRPTSPSRLEPALPTQTTLQRTALSGSSSKMISTSCPRLSRKLPRGRKPSSEESRTRHENRFWFCSRLTTRLATLFARASLQVAAFGNRHRWSSPPRTSRPPRFRTAPKELSKYELRDMRGSHKEGNREFRCMRTVSINLRLGVEPEKSRLGDASDYRPHAGLVSDLRSARQSNRQP